LLPAAKKFIWSESIRSDDGQGDAVFEKNRPREDHGIASGGVLRRHADVAPWHVRVAETINAGPLAPHEQRSPHPNDEDSAYADLTVLRVLTEASDIAKPIDSTISLPEPDSFEAGPRVHETRTGSSRFIWVEHGVSRIDRHDELG
jgi:hypothetical protein